MSENSKGVVMNQAANRYNLILLGAHHYLSWNQETLPVKHSFTFWAEGEGACLCNIIVQSTKKIKTGNWIWTGAKLSVGPFIEISWDNVGFYSVVNKNYYGEYGCQAANALGVASKSLQVSGTKSEYLSRCRIYGIENM